MVNIYLLIELLAAANADATLSAIQKLELDNCKFSSIVKLSKEKLVAQLDCDGYPDAVKVCSTRSPQSKAWFRPISRLRFVPRRASENRCRFRTIGAVHTRRSGGIPSSFREWWSRTGSNRRPQQCDCCALPTELRPRKISGI
jgi:hypothetical protein